MRLLPGWFTGEFFGTLLLVFFGCGSVCAAVTTGAQVGVFQVAIVWGLGIATAIYLTGDLSGAHLNPAVTVSLAVWSNFPKGRVLPYVVAQLCGAFVASAVLYFVFGDALRVFEKENGIVRGQAGSEASAATRAASTGPSTSATIKASSPLSRRREARDAILMPASSRRAATRAMTPGSSRWKTSRASSLPSRRASNPSIDWSRTSPPPTEAPRTLSERPPVASSTTTVLGW